MKVPVEFIAADEENAYRSNTLYSFIGDLASVRNLGADVSLGVRYAKGHFEFSNTFILDVITRTTNMLGLLVDIEKLLKVKEYKVDKELEIHDYEVLSETQVDSIRSNLGQIELLRDVLGAKLNSLYVAIIGYMRQVRHAEKLAAEYSTELTTEVALLEQLEATLRAIDPNKYEDKIKILEEVATDLEKLLGEYNTTTDVYALGDYYIARLKYVDNLIYELDLYLRLLEGRYEILLSMYQHLHTDLNELQRYAKRLHASIIDGAYVRSGDNVKIGPYGVAGFFQVSASKPDMTPCAPLTPWYTAPKVNLIKEEASCAEQPVGSPLHPDFPGSSSAGLTATTTSTPNSSTVIKNLSELSGCSPDFVYWTDANAMHQYITRLSSSSGALSPSNPEHVKAAKDYWLANPPKFNIEDTKNFYYGISVAMALASYPNLVVGSSSAFASGAAAYHNTVSDFYKCLYQLFITSMKSSDLDSKFSSWATFKSEASTAGLTNKYSRQQLLSFFLTYRWKVVCDVQNGFPAFVDDDSMIDAVVSILSGTKHACQRISFCEAQSNASLMGYAIQSNGANLRVVNVEPDSQTFNPASQCPVMFGKGQFRCVSFATTGSGQQATSGAYYAVEKAGAADPTVPDGISVSPATQLLYTLIHESAHSIDYVKGIGTNAMGFSEQTSWTSISGWKKNGNDWVFTSAFKYPSEVTASDPEPPCTVYGHAFPWEDFAEAWAFFVMSPDAMKKWYPKKYAFMVNNVVPYLNTIRR